MRTTWNFHTAGKLIFGAGAAGTIGEQLARRNWKRAFLVTDPRLIEAGIIGPIEECLRAEGIALEIFADSEPEPAIGTAQVAIAKAREFRPEAIVGIGGGSNMDLAKIVAVAATHGGEPANYFGFDRVPGPTLPIACVATTAGTGSEVSHAAVLTDTAAEMKLSTLSNYLRPALAIVDPLLTHSCPRQVTADSGIDALTHAVEAYMAIDYRQLDTGSSREIAYEGSFPLGDCLAESRRAGQRTRARRHGPGSDFGGHGLLQRGRRIGACPGVSAGRHIALLARRGQWNVAPVHDAV